jgi:prepilin-type N-terminal cleavage/methylation domain-containing protein
MTFATGPDKLPALKGRVPWFAQARGAVATTSFGQAGVGRHPPATRRAFTLVEIILAAAVIALLAGTFVLAMGRWYQRQSLDESAMRVEAIIRMARAEACSQGRLIRLAFDPSSLAPVIAWEPNPLQEPGRFVPHYGAWANDLPTDLLRFIQCRRTGQSARKLLAYSDAQEPAAPGGEPLQSITFMPDGSCDSAVIEVAAADGLDPRIGRIEINGITGSAALRMLTPIEQDEQRAIDAQAEQVAP